MLILFITIYLLYALGMLVGHIQKIKDESKDISKLRIVLLCLAWPYVFGLNNSRPRIYKKIYGDY